jgi:hypothetical protein
MLSLKVLSQFFAIRRKTTHKIPSNPHRKLAFLSIECSSPPFAILFGLVKLTRQSWTSAGIWKREMVDCDSCSKQSCRLSINVLSNSIRMTYKWVSYFLWARTPLQNIFIGNQDWFISWRLIPYNFTFFVHRSFHGGDLFGMQNPWSKMKNRFVP